jgi:hypothetical protein
VWDKKLQTLNATVEGQRKRIKWLEDMEGETTCVQTLVKVRDQVNILKKNVTTGQPAQPSSTPQATCTRQPLVTSAPSPSTEDEDPIEDADSILERQVALVVTAAAKKAGKQPVTTQPAHRQQVVIVPPTLPSTSVLPT